MNKLKKQLFTEVSENSMNKLKSSPSQKFCKTHSKITVLKIHSKTELLAYKFLPQKRHQHLLKNNYLHIAPLEKTLTLIQKYLYINYSLKKDILFKLFFFNLLYQNFLYQNHQKKFLGHPISDLNKVSFLI